MKFWLLLTALLFTVPASAQDGVKKIDPPSKDPATAPKVQPTLRAMGHDGSHANDGGQLAAFMAVDFAEGTYAEGDTARPLTTSADRSRSSPIVAGAGLIRRFTPRECERLMGWPDDHTRWRADGKEIKDGPRYKMTGNGVVKPVAWWIGRQLICVG